MKKIAKLLAVGCLASTFLMTGCIDETFPTSGATEEQVTSSDESASAMLWALHAQLNTPVWSAGSNHFDFGYGAMMHIRDVQTGDMPINNSNYDQFWVWEENQAQGKLYLYPQLIWNYYYRCVLNCNKLLGAFPLETASDEVKGYIAAAHAYRALFYLDLARLYEYLPTDVTTPKDDQYGNDITNLTVPIVTEETTEEQCYNNPRATREEMAAFILSDLQAAEENIAHLTESSSCLPHLDVVYGLYARYYLWLGQNIDDTPNAANYVQARDYARMAINAAAERGLYPMSEEECLSTSKGFNDIDCWMLGSQLVKENDVVQTGIVNWVSWMSNETSFGYCGMRGAPWSLIDAGLYAKADDNDFRKRMWKAPKGSALDGKTDFLTSTVNGYFGDFLPTYASVKFRPGEGNPDDVNLAAATAYPMMRVEEMYFIEAEAAEHIAPGKGKQLLESFMNEYRIASDAEGYKYTCTNADVIDEIITQKSIELWGEGLSFFDIKRLNRPVNRAYSGSNWSSTTRFVTSTRPAWMNYVIVQTEENSNEAVRGYNNPDPSGKYELQ